MATPLERPRVTEIQVRMDCNGCKQKIKKALHGVNGIYEFYIDFPKQKLTVVGWADPEKIIKAIKKTRKVATICSHTESADPQPPTPDPPVEAQPPAPDATNPPPPEPTPAEPTPPPEPAKEPPPSTPQSENPPPEVTPSPPSVATNPAPTQAATPSQPKDVEEIHIIHHHPHNYGYSENWNMYSSGHRFQHETPYQATHSYNTYRPSQYVSEFEYRPSPPRNVRYTRTEHYVDDYHNQGNGDGNNVTSIFSDENPNACRIV